MTTLSTEVKVGIFVFTALLALGYMSVQVGKGRLFSGGYYTLETVFDTVSGLKSDAQVETAGIVIGRVKEIGLSEGRAKVIMAISKDVQLSKDSRASIRTRGVLGDKFVEIVPGTAAGDFLKPGERMADSGVPDDMDQMFKKVGQIADDLGKVARSVSNVVGTPEGEQDLRSIVKNLKETTQSVNELMQSNMEAINLIIANTKDFTSDLKEIAKTNKDGINRTVNNFQGLSGDINDITSTRKDSIKKIIDNLEKASDQFKTTLTQMNEVMAKINNGDGAAGKLVGDKAMGDDLKKTVANLESVSKKIDEGKGSIGKLVNDDATVKELNKALDGINKYLAKQDQFKTSIDFTSEYMSGPGKFKSYLTLKLQPTSDKYYLLSIVDDPAGKFESTDTTTRTSVAGGPWVETRQTEDKVYMNRLKFSAQFAKRWGNLILRAGVIESTGGAGIEYLLLDDRVQFFFEAFDFGGKDNPHLKAGARLYFLKNFYASVGMDNFISKYSPNRSFYAGLGFTISDEDIKYLISSVPMPSSK